MSNFGYDQINTSYGFFGELRASPIGLSNRDAAVAFNKAVEVLGGEPEKARQYLNSTSGRHLGDSLTFLVPNDPSTEDVLKAIQQIPTHQQTKWAVKSYAKFEKYESVEAPKIVDQLLTENEEDDGHGHGLPAHPTIAGNKTITGKKTVKQLSTLGYDLKSHSSGGDLLVQSFIATFRGKRVHGWFSNKLGVYELD